MREVTLYSFEKYPDKLLQHLLNKLPFLSLNWIALSLLSHPNHEHFILWSTGELDASSTSTETLNSQKLVHIDILKNSLSPI